MRLRWGGVKVENETERGGEGGREMEGVGGRRMVCVDSWVL